MIIDEVSEEELKIRSYFPVSALTSLSLILGFSILLIFSPILLYYTLIIESLIAIFSAITLFSILLYENIKKKSEIIEWIFDKSLKRIQLNKIRKEIKEIDVLDFSQIESITLSFTIANPLGGIYFLSLLSKDNKKYVLFYNGFDKNRCEDAGKKISEFIEKPFINYTYYKDAFIFGNFVFFIFISLTLFYPILLLLTIPFLLILNFGLLNKYNNERDGYFHELNKSS